MADDSSSRSVALWFLALILARRRNSGSVIVFSVRVLLFSSRRFRLFTEHTRERCLSAADGGCYVGPLQVQLPRRRAGPSVRVGGEAEGRLAGGRLLGLGRRRCGLSPRAPGLLPGLAGLRFTVCERFLVSATTACWSRTSVCRSGLRVLNRSSRLRSPSRIGTSRTRVSLR